LPVLTTMLPIIRLNLTPNLLRQSLFTSLSNKGKGDASRSLQSWARKYKIADGEGPRLTLLNNWESTYFDFNEPKLAELLKDTKNLGVDLFLLDDGWFANKFPRNGDNAGLGDWAVKKPNYPMASDA
jgi:alpha-galactosidase